MAKNFLENSPTYIQKTSPDIRERRNIVCKHLNASYKVPRGKDALIFKQIKEEASKAGIQKITISIFNADKTIFRYAFRFLSSRDSEARKKLAGSPHAFGIHCLMRDGINSFEDMRKKPEETKPETENEKSPNIEPVRTSEFQEALNATYRLGEDMLSRNEDLLRENKNLNDAAELREKEITTLNEKLAEARSLLQTAHAETLESLALKYPQFPQIAVTASSMVRKKDEVKYADPERLPERFVRPSEVGTIEYKTSFLRSFSNFRKEEQNYIWKALTLFASEKGGQDRTLEIKKIHQRVENVPAGCFELRASPEIRIFWEKLPHKIRVHDVKRKGDIGNLSER